MPQSIVSIIAGGNRIILFAEDEVIITWNLSLTLQAWGLSYVGIEADYYQELSAQTFQEIPGIHAAIRAAKVFYYNRTDVD
jgi:hypothetical protein